MGREEKGCNPILHKTAPSYHLRGWYGRLREDGRSGEEDGMGLRRQSNSTKTGHFIPHTGMG